MAAISGLIHELDSDNSNHGNGIYIYIYIRVYIFLLDAIHLKTDMIAVSGKGCRAKYLLKLELEGYREIRIT